MKQIIVIEIGMFYQEAHYHLIAGTEKQAIQWLKKDGWKPCKDAANSDLWEKENTSGKWLWAGLKECDSLISIDKL